MRKTFGARPLVTCWLALAAGTATASIPAADGTYTGCYTTSVGALRVIDVALPGQRCRDRVEVQVTWSQRGPAGPAGASVTGVPLPVGDATCPKGGTAFLVDGALAGQACNGNDGATGAPGAKGDPGPPGPPAGGKAITADNFSAGFTTTTLATTPATATTVLTLVLPAGQYVLQATVGLHVDVPLGTLIPFANARCAFVGSGGPIGTDFGTVIGGSPASNATLPMLATYAAATADLVSVRCSTDGGSLAVQTQPSVAVALSVAP